MSSHSFNKGLLASSIAMVLGTGISMPLYSAENDAENDEDVIVVVGIRDTLKANLSQKRNADAVIDAINSEDIGKFPDKNLAESLQRVPGVTINRGFAGEGNEVSIRGVDPELTQTLVNGQFVASTNWFSLSFNKRSFNMDLMPSELVSNVEVYKSPVASMDEGGVGGTVVINTRKPLELDSGSAYASVELMNNSLESSEYTPSYSGMYSWKNDEENFGILASYSRAETIGRGNKAENYWEEAWSASGISQFRQDRVRDTFDVNMQLDVSERVSLGLHYFRTELDASNTNQNFLIFGGCCDTSAGQSTFVNGSGGTSPTTGIPMAGTMIGGNSNPGWAGWLLAQDVNSRRPELDSDIVDFTIDYAGDSYTVSASIGTTSAEGGNGGNVNSLWGIDDDDSRWVENGGNLSVDFDMTLASGMFINVNGLDISDPSWQTNRAASIAEVALWDEEDWIQADVDFDVNFGQFDSIKVGVKSRDHVFGKSQTNYTVDTSFLGAGATLGNSVYSGGVINVGGVMAPGSSSAIAGVSDSFDADVRANITGSEFLYSAYGEVEEEISSFYVQADFSGDNYRGNIGIRYASTDVSGTTYASATDPGSAFTRSADYSDVLPSFNFAYDLAEDKVLRLSAAKVMSRPAYGTLNPALGSINPTANTAASGNVAMDPFRANQYDIGFEWYYGDNDFFGIAYFYKDIESFVTSGSVQDLVYEPNGDQNAPNDLELYTLSVPIQGRGGEVSGVEVNLQKMFGNFGLLANATFSDSEGENDAGQTFDLPGNSELSYNLSGFYQTDKIEARLTYSYRDEYLAEGTAIAGALDVFEDVGYLDASLTYFVDDNLELSFQAINLTDETTIQKHGAGSLGSNRVTTENGVRHYLKASLRF